MPSCVFLMFVSLSLSPVKDSLGFYLNLMACCLIVVSLLVTVLVEVPIVKQIEQWTTMTTPSHWETIRDRWVKFHVIRTFAALASFAAFIASSLLLQ
jgi:uncharacterized membrane protein